MQIADVTPELLERLIQQFEALRKTNNTPQDHPPEDTLVTQSLRPEHHGVSGDAPRTIHRRRGPVEDTRALAGAGVRAQDQPALPGGGGADSTAAGSREICTTCLKEILDDNLDIVQWHGGASRHSHLEPDFVREWENGLQSISTKSVQKRLRHRHRKNRRYIRTRDDNVVEKDVTPDKDERPKRRRLKRKIAKHLYVTDFSNLVARNADVGNTTTESQQRALFLAGAREIAKDWEKRSRSFVRYSTKMTIRALQDDFLSELLNVWIAFNYARLEADAGHIEAIWVPTDETPANGLTKPLEQAKFEKFVKMLGLESLTYKAPIDTTKLAALA
ncbi:Uu.00g070280.m01.CDS01 [Anthostomella pinea]|uniref:Uu.00g070280.m01.CDS01 n=1 Tax=Anthostomella pinea TaxID=933095 RepID=A0AAI8YNM1_9PEZI|nr:Uu.00g070280.m01.CDS01 [Anthostomella pinea]